MILVLKRRKRRNSTEEKEPSTSTELEDSSVIDHTDAEHLVFCTDSANEGSDGKLNSTELEVDVSTGRARGSGVVTATLESEPEPEPYEGNDRLDAGRNGQEYDDLI